MRERGFQGWTLVTGAGGFIGQSLCTELKAEASFVRGLDLRTSQTPCDEWLIADTCMPAASAWCASVDTVFHLAGKAHALSEGRQDDEDYFRINTEGTRNVLEAAKATGVRRFVFFSTVKAMARDEGNVECRMSSVGGSVQRREAKVEGGSAPRTEDGTPNTESRRPLTEEDEVEPDTPYGKSKLEAEKLVLHGGYVPEPVVLRLCMVYGPGAKGNLAKMIEGVARNRFPPIPEVGNKRSMVHVDDVVQAAMLAAESAEAVGQVFIVSDGQAYSTRQMYEWVCQALNRPVPAWTIPLWALKALGIVGDGIGRLSGRRFVFDSDALNKLVGSAWFSSEKIQSLLGFKARWTLLAALPEIVREVV